MNKRSLPLAFRGLVTVLCIHSSGSTGGQWNALRAQLGPQALVLTPDLLGHGAGPAWSGTDQEVADADTARLVALADSLPGPVHLVGHSYGGALALRMALRRPRKFASVSLYEPVAFRVLFDCFGRRRPASEIVEVARDMKRCLRGGDQAGAAARFVDYWGGAAAWQGLSRRQQAEVAQRTPLIGAHFTALMRDEFQLADYRGLPMPVLMLCGGKTRAPARRLSELLLSAIPNAALESMPGMNHMGPITHASAVSQRIADFVRNCAFATDVPRGLAA